MSQAKQIIGGIRLEQVPGEANIVEPRAVYRRTVMYDPASQAGAGLFFGAVTIPGLRVATDWIAGVHVPATLEANLRFVTAYISADNTVTIGLQALAAVDGANREWGFIIFRR